MMGSFGGQWFAQSINIIAIIVTIIAIIVTIIGMRKNLERMMIIILSLLVVFVFFTVTAEFIVKMNNSPSKSVKVPDVYGKHKDEAKFIIEKRGLMCEIEDKYNEELPIPSNRVISQYPEVPGISVKLPSSVKIFISKGSMPRIPNVIGMDFKEAIEELRKQIGLGIPIDTIKEHSDKPGREVIYQDPEAGTSVGEDSYITITVSVGE